MNGYSKWSILGLSAAALLFAVFLGPGRIYGLLESQRLDGQVTKIQPLEPGDEGNAETYLVMLNGGDGKEYVFASSDGQWMMVKNNDWVRVTLYPAPPWSANRGQWQNAGLAAKLLPPAPKSETETNSVAGHAPTNPAPVNPTPPQPAQANVMPAAPTQNAPPNSQTAENNAEASQKQQDAKMHRGYRHGRPRDIWRRR